MTFKIDLGPALQQQVLDTNQQQARLIVDAAKPDAVSPRNRFVFFAAFDGTNNDLENAGHESNTNVAQLWTQFESNIGVTNPNVGGQYFPGPGTKGQLSNSAWLSPAVTHQVTITADNAYADFADQAANWLKRNPGKPVIAALAAFSRGAASAAIFSRRLFEKGLLDPGSPGTVLIAPGKVEILAGVLFDPVTTGAAGDLSFAPIVKNFVNIRAQDEYRQLFRARDYSKQAMDSSGQPVITTVAMLGNHCDIGGSYRSSDGGISALTLQAATDFLKKSGLPIGDVSATRRFGGVSTIAIHSEQRDDQGRPKWDVYSNFNSIIIKQPSPRLADSDKAMPPTVS